jgi:hypothetical protein
MKFLLVMLFVLGVSPVQAKKDKFEPNWEFYCQYVEAYGQADKIISREPSNLRKQRLINEKESAWELINQVRTDYKKKTGKELDESKCKTLYQ